MDNSYDLTVCSTNIIATLFKCYRKSFKYNKNAKIKTFLKEKNYLNRKFVRHSRHKKNFCRKFQVCNFVLICCELMSGKYEFQRVLEENK